jgi:hypothetical protein
MKKLTLISMLLVSATVSAQVAGMRPGLWETKVERQVLDGRDITAQIVEAQAKMEAAMVNMTPEQRQQMGAMMKGMASKGAGMRICVSPAMAAKPVALVDPNGHCPPATITTNGNKSSYSFNCVSEGRTTVGNVQSTMNGNVVTSHSDVKTTDKAGSHTMLADSTVTYLGPDCQGVVPIDQLAKGVK